jgi:hypothetical protein
MANLFIAPAVPNLAAVLLVHLGGNAYRQMGSCADILFDAKDVLMSLVGIISFPVTGGGRERDGPHRFLWRADPSVQLGCPPQQ